jgi:hypothetical protein
MPYLGLFLVVVTDSSGVGPTGHCWHLWVDMRNVAKHLTMHRTKNYVTCARLRIHLDMLSDLRVQVPNAIKTSTLSLLFFLLVLLPIHSSNFRDSLLVPREFAFIFLQEISLYS